MTERSIAWSKIEPMMRELAINKALLARALGVSRNTVGRWANKGAPIWLFRLLHLEIEVKNHDHARKLMSELLKPNEPRPLKAEDLKLGST